MKFNFIKVFIIYMYVCVEYFYQMYVYGVLNLGNNKYFINYGYNFENINLF